MDALEALLMRRSVKAQDLIAPAPNAQELEQILCAATRVPDHGKLAPWRVVVFHRPQQERLGELLARRFAELNPDATDKQIAFERGKAMRAPLLLAVLYCPVIGRIPEWEQQLSTGAVCMNVLHAAHALGYGAQWLTEWPAFDDEVAKALGCSEDDRIAGFISVGSYDEKPDDRPRPDVADVVRVWEGQVFG